MGLRLPSRALARIGLATIGLGLWGCALDRGGLGTDPDHVPTDGGGVDQMLVMDAGVDAAHETIDGPAVDQGGGIDAQGPDTAPDATPDLAPDSGPDLAPDATPDAGGGDTPGDGPAVCRLDAGQHMCSSACVDNTSIATCGTSCVACPSPNNGSATCNGTACGVACNSGYVASGATCIRSCTTTCETGAVSVNAPGGRFTGTTSGASNSTGSCGGGVAPEAVFRVVLTVASDLFVTTHNTRFDTVIYLRSGCCGVELACNDNADGRRTSVLTATNLPAGSYDVFVDGASATDMGAFSVDIFVSPTSTNAGESCGHPTHIANLALTGNTCGMRDDAQASCQTNPSGADAVYYFVLDQATAVSFNTCSGTCIDTVLSIRDVCSNGGGSSERACNDDGGPSCRGCTTSAGAQSRLAATLAAGVHYVVLDTNSNMACGDYTLTPVGVPP